MNNRYFSLEEAQEWLGKLNINSGGLPNHLQLFNTDTARKYTNYKLVFSISKNNIQRFENLLDRFLKDGFKVQISEGLRQYYEIFDDIEEAIKREKQLKAGNRAKKLDLINKFNADWIDLYGSII